MTLAAIDPQTPLTLGAQIEARALHPELGSRPFLIQHDRTWSYAEYRDQCVRCAHFLRQRLGPIDEKRSGHVAMLLENHLELLSLYGGCGYAGLPLFGINSGLKGEVLAGVLNQSRARILVVDEKLHQRIREISGQLDNIPAENILVVPSQGGRDLQPSEDLLRCMSDEVAGEGESLDAPSVDVTPESNLIVIYTSGTTGLPKGINNSHLKMLAIGDMVAARLGLGSDDRGYACMPLFHSNALFLGFQPAMSAGASVALRERFSATGFLPDLKRYGVTYWNYVGEPVHYILGAIEREFGGDAADDGRILREVAGDPENKLRFALGNGASPPDIDRFMRWFGLEDMFELYGSTEAAISTFRHKGDPRGSVGEVDDAAVMILDESGKPCANAEVDADGKMQNYAEAVGEICRVAPDAALFQGYFDNDEASEKKYRDGVYHSGDLGHIRIVDGKRFLYFDGRTDDWIRKDGENFSAAQVARLVQEDPDVVLAAAYGVPCAVSDEHVMVALKMRPGAAFDPQAFFDFCESQVENGGMDRKWFPDFVRVVDEFEYTETQKVLVRNLKRVHFDRRRLAGESLFWRQRNSTGFAPFSTSDFEAHRQEFVRAEREALLDS